MRAITVARKPLSEGNVAANVLKHGTGAINIDKTRLSTGDNLNGGAYSDGAPRHDGKENWRYERGKAGDFVPPTGRWPANMIFQHLPECVCVEGSETVTVWKCADNCPVLDLDHQSGISKSTGGRAYQNTNDMYSGGWSDKGQGISADPGFGDTGGASRFFKQVKP